MSPIIRKGSERNKLKHYLFVFWNDFFHYKYWSHFNLTVTCHMGHVMFVTCDTRRCGLRDAAWRRPATRSSHWLTADYKLLSWNKPFKSTHLEAVIFSGQITSKIAFNEYFFHCHPASYSVRRKVQNDEGSQHSLFRSILLHTIFCSHDNIEGLRSSREKVWTLMEC